MILKTDFVECVYSLDIPGNVIVEEFLSVYYHAYVKPDVYTYVRTCTLIWI